MVRRPTPPATETAVLVKSRRRCCICFGLDRDTRLKPGQIAHLDKDNTNSSEGNLAFLCLAHHDEYDSRTSQRKNFTINEVRQFRDELYDNVDRGFSQHVHFGEMKVPHSDPYAGSWIRIGAGHESAEITLTPLPDSYEGDAQYFVQGAALWGASRPYGPNIGTLQFVGILETDLSIAHVQNLSGDRVNTTVLQFDANGGLTVEEDNWFGCYGMNVNFIGDYRRAT